MMLTIIIPVYNQVDLCRNCLKSLAVQTRTDFSVVLLDDCSTGDYRSLIAEFPELSIAYTRNEANLGAIRNIFKSIFYPVHTPYTMSLHEDDLLAPSFIENALAALEINSQSVFVGSTTLFFDSPYELPATPPAALHAAVYNKADFVRSLLLGDSFMLGSVVYRSGALLHALPPQIDELSVACDRPFLIELIGDGSCVVLSEPLLYSRRHDKHDTRSRLLGSEHILKMFEFYKKSLPAPLSAADDRVFFLGSTNDILFAYRSLYPDKRPSLYIYIKRAWQRHLFRFSYVRLKGIIGIIFLFLGHRVSYSLLAGARRLLGYVHIKVRV